MQPFSEHQVTAIIIAAYTTAVLNLLGSLFTIVTFLVFKDARNVATSLVFSLALSDMSTAIATSFLWMFVNQNDVLCALQGALLMFGLVASVLWGLMIGFYMFMALYKNVDLEALDKKVFLFHLSAWGYACITAIIPLFYKQYGIMFPGSKMSWCWISDPKSNLRLMLYIPDTLIFFLLVVLYGMIRYRLKNSQSTTADVICRKMSIYVLVYALINVFGIINRLQNYLLPVDAIFELYLLQFLTQPLQGFLNAIAYVWNEPAFIDQYKELFIKCMHGKSRIPIPQIQAEQEKLMSLVTYDDVDP